MQLAHNKKQYFITMKTLVLAFWRSEFSVQTEKASLNRLMLLVFLQLAFSLGALAQDPTLPPGDNFDLSKWKITLPDQTEPKENDLVAGFESANEFYTDPTTGAMVFVCPNDGETGGSTYPRSELREMIRAGNTSISTQGIGLNNWVFSNSTVSNQNASGGVDGILRATVAVDHVSETGASNQVGRVIIGQIHGSNDEPCRIYYRKLPGNSKGAIYFAHEPITGSEQYYEMIGSRSSSASNPEDGIALGEKFSYEIKVVGNNLTVTIIRPGKSDVQQVVDMSGSGYADDWMYFKAGVYNQNNGGDPGEYAQASFFALSVSHSTSNNNGPTASITSPSNNENFYSGEGITITADASDSDGTINKVEFYDGNTKIGEDNSSPYMFVWNDVPVGNRILYVKATDNDGASTTSLGFNIPVNEGFEAPYNIPRFQAFLGECKLQAPTSSTIASQSQLIAGYKDDNFYVADGDKVAFNQTGSSMRTELRHETNWTLSEGDRSLHARINIIEQTCDQFTMIQIHDDANAGSGPNKPLLRVYKHLTRTPVNHLWAAIKTDAGGSNTTHIDLGLAPEGYFDCDVKLVGGNMIIDVDGVEKVNMDVSYWSFPSYWKAGVYLQDDGEATAYFDRLYTSDGNDGNNSPSVSITTPVHQSNTTVGNDIVITAEAGDPDGSIVKVVFYEGTNELGEDTSSPYSYTWTDAAVGNYTLTAIATDDEGAMTTSSDVDITVDNLTQYTLTTNTVGSGSISSDPSGGTYDDGTVVELIANPDSGYKFDGWSGDANGASRTTTVTMDSDKSVTANFSAVTFTLTTPTNGQGSVTLSPTGGEYIEGTVVTLTAIPDSGNRFVNWTGAASGTSSTTTITMDSHKSATANFDILLSSKNLESPSVELTTYPNPFNFMTIIEYELIKVAYVELSIYNLSGRKIVELINESQRPGTQKVEWHVTENLPRGLYLAKLKIGDEAKTLRIMLTP